jgi:FkbM family methyltransferase
MLVYQHCIITVRIKAGESSNRIGDSIFLKDRISIFKTRFLLLKKISKLLIRQKPKKFLRSLLQISYVEDYIVSKETIKLLNLQQEFVYGLKGDNIFAELASGIFREKHFLLSMELPYLKKSEMVMLDIGANHGTHTRFMSTRFPDAMVHSFEANPRIFPILQLNTIGLANVKTYQFAVAESTGNVARMSLVDFKADQLNSGFLATDKSEGIDTCLTMEIDSLNLKRCDFMKIDVQGSEFSVLEGASKTIDSYKPVIFIEIEERYLNRKGRSSEELLRFIHSFNYEIFRFKTDYPTDHIAIPGDSEIKALGDIQTIRIPKSFKGLSFKNRNYYEEVF